MIELVAGTQTKPCSKCKEVKPLSEFYGNSRHSDGRQSECKACKNAHNRVLHSTRTSSGMSKHREYVMRQQYGIEPLDYLRMYAGQAGKCMLCGTHKEAAGFGGTVGSVLVVDHNHTTNDVRGLLCHECNTLLGFLEQKRPHLLNALRYIRTNGREAEIGA